MWKNMAQQRTKVKQSLIHKPNSSISTSPRIEKARPIFILNTPPTGLPVVGMAFRHKTP